MKAHDDLIFNMTGATMAHDDLTFNVIGATIESPSQNPLLAFISWELALGCRGAGLADSRLTSPRDPLALLREVPLPLSF